MKLGLIELDHHVECLNSLCQIVEDSDFEITVFTTPKLYAELASYSYSKKYKWQIAEGDVTQFIHSQKAELEAQSLLFFSTIESNFNAFNKLNLNVKRLVRIHNAQTFLAQKFTWNAKLSAYWMFKDASYVLRKRILNNEFAARKTFLANTDFICFTSNEITNYVRKQQNFAHVSKIVNAIPITFNEHRPTANIKKAKTFAVIGTIDRKRKDYHFLWQAINQLIKTTDETFELKILGKPKGGFGKSTIEKFKKLQTENFSVKVWPNGVPQKEFDAEMQSVDVILAPIFKSTKYFLWEEIYGSTKISGSINDCIKYGKLGLIPDFYALEDDKKPLFLTYKNLDDFCDVVQKLMNGSTNATLHQDAFKPFSQKAIKEQAIQEFLKLI